ncbi:hypothetical protein ACFVH9_23510 [Streptomyces hirsutus]|uniref:hypothetical protein n=1 Tax=Streptomyces hirsutus TaxID=35620 RepID=UPI003644D078
MTTILTSVTARGLTAPERTVALYASDMPDRQCHGAPEQLALWIAQGAERLGTAELRRLAEFFHGFFLLEMDGMVTPALLARHEQCFPDMSRLDVANEAAALSVRVHGMSETARTRDGAASVDDCPCGGTGVVDIDDPDPDLSFSLYCPVHLTPTALRIRAGAR